MSQAPNHLSGSDPETGAFNQIGANGSSPVSKPAAGRSKIYALMASGTLVSRVLGFVRTALLAVAIGSVTSIADIFEKANVIPTIIYMLLAGGVFNVILIPQLIKASKANDRGSSYTSKLVTLTIVVMGALTVLLTIAARPIIIGLTNNWSDEMITLGTSFAYWSLPQVFFYGLYAVLGQVLNAHGRFAAFMWAPAVNNLLQLVVIGSFIWMFSAYSHGDPMDQWNGLKTVWLAGGATLGIVLQALVLLWPLRKLGLNLHFDFSWRGIGLRHVGKLALWTIAAMMIGNIASLLYSKIVSGATAARTSLDPQAAASVAGEYALNTSQLITVLPHSLFALTVATVLFNDFTKAFTDNRREDIGGLLNRGMRSTAIPIVFATVAFIVLAGPLGRLFAGHSQYAVAAACALGQLLVLTALGLPFKSLQFFMLRVFFADEDTRTPMLIQTTIAMVGLVSATLAAILVDPLHIAAAIALIYGATNVLSAVVTHYLVKRRYGDYGVISVIDTYVRIGWMATLSGLAGALTLALLGGLTFGFAYDSVFSALVTIAVVSVVMASVYFFLLHRTKVPELEGFAGPIIRRIPGLRRK
ncbi:murein biosynthesis integral membrane protein MurJ [Glutamicibacter sp. PS]|uniref:murein biosynthesis integral membrane protein MurJ n=1 Tax=Glutamicibacter sp. PS TaxID=3075634 RepID=UPI00284DFBB0|nr:murein biosynthesis integral membrane protein MurJ [Glutamicibacter sp. PS]MDR4534928.1 murein biosynthesis integral membrane protein MurJ [Glutamicibacter sp. PS]